MAIDQGSVVEQIKSRINIVDLVSRYVNLKKVGKNYSGLCPFHAEKTPSFFVNPVLNIFKCFGCGIGGDIFKFLMEIERISFKEALEKLAKEAGIDLDFSDSQVRRINKKNKLLKDVNKKFAEIYSRILQTNVGRSAMEYIYNKRKIKKEMLNVFGIGYAPPHREFVKEVAKRLNLEAETLKEAGLLNDDGISRFRHRVMFPIYDVSGAVVGFTARTLYTFDGVPKYINTPETPIFKKRFLLYGLYQAKQEIIKQNKVILTEGALDVISSFQAGVQNIVAPLGTSLTETQLIVLKRFTKNIIFAYDNDLAGQKALHRAVVLALSQGMRPHVLMIPEEFKDIDEFIHAKGAAAWRSFVDSHVEEFFEHAIKVVKQKQAYKYTEFEDYLEELLYILSFAEPLRREIVTKQLAEVTGLSENTLMGRLEMFVRDKNRYSQALAIHTENQAHTTDDNLNYGAELDVQDARVRLQQVAHNLSQYITKLIVHHPVLLLADGLAEEYNEFITIPEYKAIIRNIREFLDANLVEVHDGQKKLTTQEILQLNNLFLDKLVDGYSSHMQVVSHNSVFEVEFIDLAASSYDIPVVLDSKAIEVFQDAFYRLKKVVLKLKIKQTLSQIDDLEKQEQNDISRLEHAQLEEELKEYQKKLQKLEDAARE